MLNKISSWKKAFGKNFKKDKSEYIGVLFILIAAFFVRVYRVDELLGFYFDQGRDALVIWDLIKNGRLFLIGPVTGLPGIFLGPFFYYLLAPFYFLGQGNPVYPAVFLAALSTFAVFMLYYLGKTMHSKEAGILAAIIGAFSYHIFLTSRWLSNPNPILLSSVVLLWALWKIVQRKGGRWWVLAALIVGISLHFEAASAVFYIPLFAIFTIWQVAIYKTSGGKNGNAPGIKTALLSAAVFFATLLPQILFDFRHGHILFNNFSELFLEERAFSGITKYLLETRLEFFWSGFSNLVFINSPQVAKFVFGFLTLFYIANGKKFKKGLTPLFAIFLLTPVLGYLFFHGNHGAVYTYYISGYFLPFILLTALLLGELWRQRKGMVLVVVFMFLFFIPNGKLVKDYLVNPVNGETDIYFKNQMAAVDWVFEDARDKEFDKFNVDVYVPPVIPHAYDYLFLWQGTERCGGGLCGLVEEAMVKSL